jgi:hypothetical protein
VGVLRLTLNWSSALFTPLSTSRAIEVSRKLLARLIYVRASPAVEGPQAEIRRYLAPDDVNFSLGEAHVSSGEPRALFKFKQKVDENGEL